MIMDHQLKNFLKFPGIHSGHEDDMEKAEMSLLTSLLKKNIKADPTETMKFTYQKTLEELPDVPAPSYSRIKSALYRVRAKELPPLPKSPEEIKLTPNGKIPKVEKEFS